MKMKLQSIGLLTLLFTFCICILIYSNSVISSVSFSISIWKDNLFPSLFPFFVLSDLLIHYGFIELCGFFFQGIMKSIFYLPKEASFALVASMVSGFPSSSKYVKDLLDHKKIEEDAASYLLSFTHFSNPLFILGTIGVLLLNDKHLALLILLSHFLGNFIVAFILRKKRKINESKESFHEVIKKIIERKRQSSSFIVVLTSSLWKSFKTLVLLLGIITTFLVFTSVIQELFHFSPFMRAIIGGILEMTQGIKYVSALKLSPFYKGLFITSFLSFGGFSIHFQVFSILEDYKIKYKHYFNARILHILSSIILFYFFFIYF